MFTVIRYAFIPSLLCFQIINLEQLGNWEKLRLQKKLN